jgi:mannose-6-phosphate isomerase-like protein (cupin superfamily)
MPKISKETVEGQDYGGVEVHEGEVGEYTVNILSFQETQDMTPMFTGLPEGRCQCPHWGYVLKGRQSWRFADHEEVFEAGDAFYVGPGHVPVFEAGTEMIQFSPTQELKATDDAIRKYMEANA